MEQLQILRGLIEDERCLIQRLPILPKVLLVISGSLSLLVLIL
jgi:hypothetical protein